MTLITSKHFDDNFLNAEYLRIATQVNSAKSTSLAVGKNYDRNRLSALIRALVTQVNTSYSASLVPVSNNYDNNLLGEMLNRISAVVNAGGGGSYVAKAVHFDGANASLGTSSLTASNSAVIGCAYWIKLSSPLTATNSIWVTDPNDTYNGQQGPGNTSGKVFSRIEDDFNAFRFNSTIALSTNWTCVILAMDGANGVGKLYFGDVDVTGSPTFTAALVAPFNGLPFLLGDDGGGDGATFDIADFRFAPGQTWLVSGDIPLATRRLFIDGSGKPVNPSTATTQLGAPAVLLSGDHTAFATNQGTGGTFTLTGALTDASTHP